MFESSLQAVKEDIESMGKIMSLLRECNKRARVEFFDPHVLYPVARYMDKIDKEGSLRFRNLVREAMGNPTAGVVLLDLFALKSAHMLNSLKLQLERYNPYFLMHFSTIAGYSHVLNNSLSVYLEDHPDMLSFALDGFKGTPFEGELLRSITKFIDTTAKRDISFSDFSGLIATMARKGGDGGLYIPTPNFPSGKKQDKPTRPLVPAGGGSDTYRRSPSSAYLDALTLGLGLLVSLIYLLLATPMESFWINLGCFVLPAVFFSVAAHEFAHWRAIRRYKKDVVDYQWRGLYFRFTTGSGLSARKIISAGKNYSGVLALAAALLLTVVNHDIIILLGLVNSIFAFSFRDRWELAKMVSFKEAPQRFIKAIRKARGSLLRIKKRPLIALIGGYFASGKGELVRRIHNCAGEGLTKRFP